MAGYFRQDLPNVPNYRNMDFGASDMIKAGEVLSQSLNSVKDRELLEAKLAQEQKKYETELGFKQRAEDRLLKEQAASDQYYKSLLGGPQAVGGALNTQSFINEANKYSLTPEEIAFSNANKITTAEQARQLGNENLAKKFEGQTGLSNLSDILYSEGALQESRVQMLERALGNVANQGLPVPKELATQIDQARSDEQTAQEARLKANTDELANLTKERKNDLKWLVGNINSGNGTATVLDEDGNPVTVSTGKALQKEITASNKSASTGIEDLQTSINKLGLSKEKKLDAIARANELVSALEAKGIPTAEASGIVAKEMVTKENNPYLSYIGFSNMGPDANKEAIASYGDMLVDRYRKLNNVSATATSLDNNSKYKAAEAFVQGSGAATDAQIAKLMAERKTLLMSPEERMRSRIDSAVAGLNPSAATGTTYKNPILGETKMPPSLVEAEGVRMKPYKDTKGVVTVGVGYAFNKDRSEIESDFKAAGIPTSKIDGLMKMDGTQLTPKEVAALADVSYDRHGVQKLEKIGIDLKSMNPMLAEIGVVQAFRGDIIKGGSGYQGKLYDYLKNNDLDGMTKYVKSSGEVPKEVRQRLNTVVNRYGPKTEEQYKYDVKDNSTGTKPGIKELFDKSGTNSGSDTTESKKTDLEKVESTLNILNKGRTEPLKGSKAVDALVSNGVDRIDAKNAVFKNARIYSTSPESQQVEIKRNYLIAKREGKPYNGATADEWYDLMNTKQKIGAQGWVFPLIAAAPVAFAGGASILGGGAAGATESTIVGSAGRQTAIESVLPKVTKQVNVLEKEIPQLTKQYEKMREVIASKKYNKESAELADRVLNEIKSRQEMLRNLTKDKEVLNKLSGKSNSGDSKILEELIKKY